jgi:hypothetical protein
MDRRWFCLLPAVCLLAGCGPAAKADVSGKVSHQGKAVAYGVVTVRGPDGIDMLGAIQPDGSYTVQGVTPGLCKVAVSSPDPSAQAKQRAARSGKDGKKGGGAAAQLNTAAGQWFPLPAKYESVDSSGITTTLTSGANQYNVELP